MSQPTTEAGNALNRNADYHARNCDFQYGNAKRCTCGLLTRIVAIEAEARADADAQIAALRGQLTEFVTWADDGEDDDGIVARGKAVLADTQSAAKAHDEALVKPWLEWVVARDDEKHVVDWACGECITVADYARDMIVPGFQCIPHQARALLRDTE